jgi:surface protein
MSYTPVNNTEFNDALKYYFGDSQEIPDGDTTNGLSFLRQKNINGAIASLPTLNGKTLTISELKTNGDSLIIYPPFYEGNQLIQTKNGIQINTSNSLTLDLNKPIRLYTTSPYYDTVYISATSTGQSGTTYNATFLNESNINFNFIVNKSFSFTRQNLLGNINDGGPIDGNVLYNGVSLDADYFIDNDLFVYPPFYNSSNELITELNGTMLNTGGTVNLDLTKPILFKTNSNHDIIFVKAIPKEVSGYTFNATFNNLSNITLTSKITKHILQNKIGYFIENRTLEFKMQQNNITAIGGVLKINGQIINLSDNFTDLIVYPPFYNTNNDLLTNYQGIYLDGNSTYLDLTKPIRFNTNPGYNDTAYVFGTSINQEGNTYNATFLNNDTIDIEIISKSKELISNWDISNVTNLDNVFKNRTTFNEPLNNWNTSNITSTVSTFQNAQAFNQPLNNWNTSNVTNMLFMFQNARLFNKSLNSWNTSNVINMIATFQDAIAFNQPLNNWDTSKVTNMSSMFQRAIAFNQPLNLWNISNCQDMSYMLQGCRAFNKPLGSWNTSKVVNMAHMFRDAVSFNQSLSNWDTSKVTTMANMFQNATSFNQDITKWKTINVIDMTSMFQGASVFNQVIRVWVVDKNVILTNMFLGSSAMINEYLGTQYFGSTPTYRYFGYTFDYVPSKHCGDEGIQGSSGRCKEKPEYKKFDTGGNDPKFNPAYAYALYVRGSLGRPGYQKLNISNKQLNLLGSYEGARGSGVRAPPRNSFN